MHFCARLKHCKVHWRMGRRLGLCRLISVQYLIGSTTRAFSVGSALWALEVCVVDIDTVSVKVITARYGGRLSE